MSNDLQYYNKSEIENKMHSVREIQTTIKMNLIKNLDYGQAFAGAKKLTLLRSGAEKILFSMGLTSTFVIDDKMEDYDKGFFMYRMSCIIKDKKDRIITVGFGSCNSKERKYRSDKIDNFDIANTVLKMARKRAMVDAALTVASISNEFTQDMEDINQEPVFDIKDFVYIFFYELFVNSHVSDNAKLKLSNTPKARLNFILEICHVKDFNHIAIDRIVELTDMFRNNELKFIEYINKKFGGDESSSDKEIKDISKNETNANSDIIDIDTNENNKNENLVDDSSLDGNEIFKGIREKIYKSKMFSNELKEELKKKNIFYSNLYDFFITQKGISLKDFDIKEESQNILSLYEMNH